MQMLEAFLVGGVAVTQGVAFVLLEQSRSADGLTDPWYRSSRRSGSLFEYFREANHPFAVRTQRWARIFGLLSVAFLIAIIALRRPR